MESTSSRRSCESTGDADAIISAVERLHQPSLHEVDTRAGVAKFAIVPKGMEAVSIREFADEYRERPARRKGTATFFDAASFVEHVKRFASEHSTLFANPGAPAASAGAAPQGPSIAVVYDYHPAGKTVSDAEHLGHRAIYRFPLSEEWKTWLAGDGKAMDQATFAAFIESRIQDVLLVDAETDPVFNPLATLLQVRFAGPTELVTLSRGLQVSVESVVKEAVTLSTGEIAVQFVEQHTDGRGTPVKIANAFALAIPVFYGDAPYRLAVRLRYRVQGGRITWSYHLHRADRAFDDAFRRACIEIGDATERLVLLGAPEA